jgi:hypothetical protein
MLARRGVVLLQRGSDQTSGASGLLILGSLSGDEPLAGPVASCQGATTRADA